ncbi:hypothetical protein Riv7116_1907 [Rivularia sp. PCC 7116]|uniref:hypothetical protein n=1 Tax=Rivularia sp. PCC 7116 TaxID=373994 RepID=UPI00029F1D53|nr:hypothetical protein [Rivularia sp. PCC 7116]AFY54448.1 hypothetical protein Riv7116_1907 [Rivularia sp. PCC 7116]
MSSASNGRYQSRLFNFFHKQSRRLGERFGRSLRQLQVATSWYAEALSKSIYLLVQKAADSAGTQLPGTTEESKLYLQPSQPVSDSAIARVIANVETRYITTEPDISLKSTSRQTTTANHPVTANNYSAQKIQGVASQLSSQNLVLVTSNNEILDILTPSQQQALENQIISEIANYWRLWRLSQENQETKISSRTNNFLNRFISDKNAKKALPGVDVEEREHKYLSINPATVASLDTVVANLETNALVPVSRAQLIVRQRSGELIKVARTKLDIFFYGNQEKTLSKEQVVADRNLETQKSKIQTLISAAFNYFYTKPAAKEFKQTPHRSYLASGKIKTPQLQSQASADDWLSSSDLFGNGFPQLNPRNKISNKLAASQQQLDSSPKVNSSEKLFGRFQLPNWRTLRLKEKAGLQKPQENTRINAIKNSAKSQQITISPTSELQNTNKGEITQTQADESTQMEAKPEWIETKAEIIGYQKHPLEQVLAWIDNTMLKIEEVIVKFAKALQQFWWK